MQSSGTVKFGWDRLRLQGCFPALARNSVWRVRAGGSEKENRALSLWT